MAVEIIDLTKSSPQTPIVVKDIEEISPTRARVVGVEGKKRQRSKRRRNEGGDQDERWSHDKYLDDTTISRGEKWKRSEGEGDSRRRKQRERSLSPRFEVDIKPGDVMREFLPPLAVDGLDNASPSTKESIPAKSSLLLPAHVTLATVEGSPRDDNIPHSPESVGSGIDFVDDDRVVGAPRYFNDRTTMHKAEACKRCGDSDHNFKHCTALICLTCGARDEHNSRSCPILRSCWNCKGKGHVVKNCPQIGDMDPRRLDREDCERCGSIKHHGTNCPTIWRIYTYLTDTERDAVLADRESKRKLGFENGGEGYIAHDEWCYNCGNGGHLGDDCDMAPSHDKPDEYSAFGSYNRSTGPFASSSSVTLEPRRAPREWEVDDRFDDGYGFSAQTNVGRRGRENAKAKAREAQRLMEEADDEPDWFSRNQAASAAYQDESLQSTSRVGFPPKPSAPTIQLGYHKSRFSRDSRDPRSATSTRPPLLSRIDLGDNSDLKLKLHGAQSRNEETQSDVKKRDQDTHSRKDQSGRGRGNRWRGGYDR